MPAFVTSVGIFPILFAVVFEYKHVVPWMENIFIISSVFDLTIESVLSH
jgi:hypothetical protein